MFVRTEGAVPTLYVYVDSKSSDVGGYVSKAKVDIEEHIKLPTGYFITWSGQFEFMEEADKTLSYVIPATILLVFLIIYLNTRSAIKTAIVMLASAVFSCRRSVVSVHPRLQHERCNVGRHDRACRTQRRDWSCNASLSRYRI